MDQYRSIFRIVFTYSMIALSIWITKRTNYYFYPMAILIIANQAYTLTLFGHEGTHFLIFKNRSINTLIARYFCHFPNFCSHSFYTNMHLNHHRFLGSNRDPDIPIYQLQYPSVGSWILESFKEMIKGRIVFDFLNYFNGLYLFFRYPESYPKIENDYKQFFLFWTFLITFFVYFNLFQDYLVFWIIPLLFSLPWIKLINSYHHFNQGGPVLDFSRNIKIENPILREFLFPLNSTYHGMHHDQPNVPYYNLPKLQGIQWTPFTDISPIIFYKRNTPNNNLHSAN